LSRFAVVLAASVALSVSVRLAYAWGAGDERVWGWQWIQVTYLELATNIAQKRGYVLALAPEAQSVQSASPGLPPLASLPHDFGHPYRPIQYFLPAYAYVMAPAVALGGADWQTARTLNAVLDGTAGPLLVYLLLSRGGAGNRPAVIAALLYAVSPQLTRMDAQVMPDSLSSVLSLLPAAVLAIFWSSGRLSVGSALTGASIGLGCAFRGEMIALLPFVVGLLVLVASTWRQRLMLGALLIIGWLLASLPLAMFWGRVYGEFAVSRPGLGIQLWEGIGGFPNPWNVQASDAAAAALLSEHGLSYGTAAGDAFLLREAFEHLRESPGFLIHMIAVRGRDVARYGFEGWFEWWPVIADAKAALGLALAGVACVGAVVTLRRDPFLFGLLACLWLSRVVPFSIVEVQPRFLIPLQVTYGCVIACGVVAVIAASRTLPRQLAVIGLGSRSPSKPR
jgi:4-amino-4-deoxy-L-arabinose transferase-like glycosyltransferase